MSENKSKSELEEIIEPVLYKPVLEETEETEVIESENRWKRLGPISAGMFSFLLGIVYFLPIESLAREALKIINKSGVEIKAGDISLSLAGNIQLKEVEAPIDAKDSQKEKKVKIKDISGDISVLSFLFSDSLQFQTVISGLELAAHPVEIRGGFWEAETNIQDIKKKKDIWKGNLKITGSQVQVYYNEELPIVEKFATLLDKIILEGNLKDNTFYVTKAVLEGADLKAEITGNIRLMKQPVLNTLLTVTPSDSFYERYKEMGLKDMIQSMGFLNPEGKIEIDLTGNMNAPRANIKKTRPK